MQERFDKYAADYAGFAAEGRPAEGMMWSVTGMRYEQGPEVTDGEMLAVERKKRREVMEAVEVPTRKKDGGAAKGKGVEGKEKKLKKCIRLLGKRSIWKRETQAPPYRKNRLFRTNQIV